MLVLIGEQGSYKTTWFNYLLPPDLTAYFYTKTNANRMTKDDLLTLSQYGLICCEELDTMRPAELNQLKAAMTMPAVDERAAYARYHEHRKHIASFCGTGNNVQFLSDSTGNRRWLPFEIESIESPRSSPFNYEGIYSQAYALYRQGFQYWFSPDEIRHLARHNEAFETASLEKELIDQYFRRPEGLEPGEFLPVSMALQIVGANITQKLSANLLGRAFMQQGFRFKKSHGIRGYVVVRRSAEEMRVMRQVRGGADGAEGASVF
jgi:predicted P-loop ATPase